MRQEVCDAIKLMIRGDDSITPEQRNDLIQTLEQVSFVAPAAGASPKCKIGPGYLRVKGAAKYLSVSERTMNNLMRRRAVPFRQLSRRIILFSISDLDQILMRYRVNAVGEEPAPRRSGMSRKLAEVKR